MIFYVNKCTLYNIHININIISTFIYDYKSTSFIFILETLLSIFKTPGDLVDLNAGSFVFIIVFRSFVKKS